MNYKYKYNKYKYKYKKINNLLTGGNSNSNSNSNINIDPTITELNLSNKNIINNEVFKNFVSALQTNNHIVKLNLSSNNLGDEGVTELVKILTRNTTLTKLNLSNNNITDIGATQLYTAILNNKTLIYLNLSRNKINNFKTIARINRVLLKNKLKIELPINVMTNKMISLFTGTSMSLYNGILYLLNKHENSCYITNEETNEFEDIQIIYEKDNIDINIILPENFKENFKNCTNNYKKRFVFIIIGEIQPDSSKHANCLIYDKILDEFEIYEPFGKYIGESYYDKLKEVLQIEFNKDIKIYYPLEYCPNLSHQYLESMANAKITDVGGFCAAWVLFYCDMRLSYPDKNRADIIKESIAILSEENNPIYRSNKSDGKYTNTDNFKNFIRNYSSFIMEYTSIIHDDDELVDIKYNLNKDCSNVTNDHIRMLYNVYDNNELNAIINNILVKKNIPTITIIKSKDDMFFDGTDNFDEFNNILNSFPTDIRCKILKQLLYSYNTVNCINIIDEIHSAEVNVDRMKYYLEIQHCNPNIKDEYGIPLLYLAISMYGDNDDSHSHSHSHSDNNNNYSHNGQSKKMLSIINLLLDNPKIDPNLKDRFGITPLHEAIFKYTPTNNMFSIIKSLVKNNKIDVNVKNNVGNTPLVFAINKYTNDIDTMRIIELLLDNGADINLTSNSNSSLLHEVVQKYINDNNNNNMFRVVEYLLNRGIDKTIKNNNGHTAYDMATIIYNETNNDNLLPIINILK
jgi:hypothetical protein